MSASRSRQRYEDPTHTLTLQREYARKLRGRLADINTEIRAGVRDRDVFGLRESRGEQLADYDADPVGDFSFDRDARKVRQFRDWLDEQLEQGPLEAIAIDDNQYIRRAYESGIESANTDLRAGGVGVDETEMFVLGRQPIHRDKLELLFARNYRALEGITDDIGKEISRVLSDSLAEGVNPNEAARRVTDRVDSVGKTRATTMARTEILNAHNESALTRYEQILGPDASVTIHAEILTANDQRTCDICEPRHGQVMAIEEARSNGPPFHPQCRCTFKPVVENG